MEWQGKWQKRIRILLSWNLHLSYSILFWIYSKQHMFMAFCYLNNKSREWLPKSKIGSLNIPFPSCTVELQVLYNPHLWQYDYKKLFKSILCIHFLSLFNRKKHPSLFKPGKHLSSHVKPMLVSLISSTHLHNKIYDMAFQ